MKYALELGKAGYIIAKDICRVQPEESVFITIDSVSDFQAVAQAAEALGANCKKDGQIRPNAECDLYWGSLSKILFCSRLVGSEQCWADRSPNIYVMNKRSGGGRPAGGYEL